MFDVANQLDLDLRIGLFAIRLDYHKIGMGARLHLTTGSAGAAGVRFLIGRQRFAEQRLRQAQGEKPFPDAIITMEEIRMRDTVLHDRRPEQCFGAGMSDDISEGHSGPVMQEVRVYAVAVSLPLGGGDTG